MKTTKYAIIGIVTVLFGSMATTSCSDMLESESSSFLTAESNKYDQASDSLYSAMGILSQVQQLAERYVLFGELRGDLVRVNPSAAFSLQEISNFNVSADNQYRDTRDFYRVINNCNYALTYMDTTITEHNRKVMLPEYTAIRAMRAWTWMQTALAFGEVRWYTEPILKAETTDNYPLVNIDEAFNRIIEDLAPYAGMPTPDYGNADGYDSRQFFLSPDLILADLCLYNNQYAIAAQLYYNYIDRNNLRMDLGYQNRWYNATRTSINSGNLYAYNNDVISRIPFSSSAREYHPNLINLTYSHSPAIIPSANFVEDMNSAVYYHIDNIDGQNITGVFEGDLRGVAPYADNSGEYATAFGNFRQNPTEGQLLITKFFNNGSENSSVTTPDNKMFDKTIVRLCRSVTTYRVPTVYLRYAEAVNRTGRPTMAFAVLSCGLKSKTLSDSTIINQKEIEGAQGWLDFNNFKFDENYGSQERGRGYGVALPKSGNVIPELATLNDSIEWVEEEILREMAAETCFEGNRFFDLMRMSHHRADHPALMADKIGRRFDNKSQIIGTLSNKENWWIK